MPEPEPKYDGTVTWMGVTMTVEQSIAMRRAGLNPWLTVMMGYPVPLAADDPRRLDSAH